MSRLLGLVLFMAQEFVRVQFGEGVAGRRKLRFRHKDLRDASLESNKNVGALLMDPFSGWPYLIRYGQRAYDLNVSLDDASELIELFVNTPDAKTKKLRPLSELGKALLDALNASGLIRIEADFKDEKDDEPAEGNETPEATA